MGRGRRRRGRGAGSAVDVRQPVGSVKHDGSVKQVTDPAGRGRGGRFGRSGRGFDFRGYLLGGSRRGAITPVHVETEVRDDGILRHHEVLKAHGDSITSIVVTPDAIYTASRDKSLKRWKPQKAAAGRFEVVCDLEVPLSECCFSMAHAGEWLFCGLANGVIRGFQASGAQYDLKDNAKRITALLVHQHVLVSGSSDMTVRCWTAGPDAPFKCTHRVAEDIPGSVSCLGTMGRCLWVGTTGGIGLVELGTLKVTSQLMPKKFVTGFVTFQGHMVTAYGDGSLVIYSEDGSQKHSQQALPPGPIISLGLLESGPRIICGHSRGHMSCIILPTFALKKSWQAVERSKLQCVTCAGQDGIFLVGAENGTLQLWQRDDAIADL